MSPTPVPHNRHLRDHDAGSVAVAVVTVSDTRTLENDRSGDCVADLILQAGHSVASRVIVSDDVDQIRKSVRQAVAAAEVSAVIVTGGTGIARRDVTPEAIEPLLDVRLDGFGELFRSESFAEIGPRAMLSRAIAGRIQSTVVFVLPGSTGACRTGVSKCILPVLAHAIAIARS